MIAGQTDSPRKSKLGLLGNILKRRNQDDEEEKRRKEFEGKLVVGGWVDGWVGGWVYCGT